MPNVRQHCLGILLLGSTLAISGPAQALTYEWLTVNPLSIETLINMSGWYRDTNNRTDASRYKQRQYTLKGGLRLSQSGYFMDPGILRFNYTIEPWYSKGRYRSNTYSEKQKADSLGYHFGIDFLQGTTLPVRGSLLASDSTYTSNSNMGRHDETDLKNYTALLSWLFRPLPMTFRYNYRDFNQISSLVTRSADIVRNETEQVFAIQAKNAKMQIKAEHRSLDDKVKSRDNDFEENRATLRHRFTWGHESQLDSRFKYYNRTGYNALKSIELNESATIHHTKNVTSRTTYVFNQTGRNDQAKRHTGIFRLTHTLYQNLRTSGYLLGRDSRSANLAETEGQVGLGANYNKNDFKGIGVNLFARGYLARHNRTSKAGFLEVSEQSRSVPLTGEVILNDRFIETGTIIVTDATRTVIYEQSIDYEIEALVDNLTRLLVLPGGRIQTGDVILISYNSAILPSARYNQFNSNNGFTLRFGQLSVSYADYRVNYKTLSGAGTGFLSNTRDSNAHVEYVWNTKQTTNQLGVERRKFSNGAFSVTSDTINQSTSFRFSRRMLVNLTATASVSKTREETIDLYLLNLNLTWQPNPRWTIRPDISAHRRKSNRSNPELISTTEDILSAGLEAHWAFRKLTMDFSARHNERTIDNTKSRDNSLRLYLRRRF